MFKTDIQGYREGKLLTFEIGINGIPDTEYLGQIL